jgi:predicted RNA-binding protein
MCQANVYIEHGGREELVMENVDVLEPKKGEIFIRSLFGEEKVLPLRIKLISLVNNKIILQE